MIDQQAILDAAHAVYSCFYADALEDAGGRFPAGCRLEEVVPRQPDHVQLPIVWRYLGRIEGAWGCDLGLVLYHMGLEDQSDALFALLMGCLGHGVCLADDFEAELVRAGEILGKTFDPVPCYFEGNEWRELAEDELYRLDPNAAVEK